MADLNESTRDILNRRGVVSIGVDTLRSLFDLPEDVHITYVATSQNRFAIHIGLVSERFEETPPLAEARHIGWAQSEMQVIDGKPYWRLGVDWDAMHPAPKGETNAPA